MEINYEKLKDTVANLHRVYSNERQVIVLLTVLDGVLDYAKSLEDRLEARCDDLEASYDAVSRQADNIEATMG